MSWPIEWPASVDADALDPDIRDRAEALAAASMRMLTLYRVGGSPSTVMPTGRTCHAPVMRRDMFAAVASASALKACNCSMVCGCAGMNAVFLAAPVGDVYEVKVDGVILDPSTYHVEDGNKLIRHGIGATWPVCAGKDFTVTYLNGHKVDAMGAYAGGVLAAEFLKAITADKKCRLSARVTSVSRQGTQMELTPGMFPDGTTGLEEVDVYLRMWNPNGLKQAPAVYSLDLPTVREVTWGAI